jgi:hypothetical protein
MNFELTSRPYQFECPPDANWLPSRHSLFDEAIGDAYIPSQQRIIAMRDSIKSKWDADERKLRRLRSTIACELGVCRNH